MARCCVYPNMKSRSKQKEDGPQIAKVIRVWRSNAIKWSTIRVYLRWVRRFREDCPRRGVVPEQQLREQSIHRWTARYIRGKELDRAGTTHIVHSALWAWSWGLEACGYTVPQWKASPLPPSLPPLQDAFCRYRVEVCGVAPATVRRDLRAVQEFLRSTHRHGPSIGNIQVAEIDRFLEACSCRLARKTLARVACALRSFLRFLYACGHIRHDLASSVASPRVRRGDQPPRALPWSDVRRILRAIDRTTRTGRRDYALLLMMAVYGFGSGEVLGLGLDSLDWRRREVRVVRPKTGREICLPLLPPVARALAAYLRRGRPRHCTTRAMFPQMHAPYGSLQSSAIRHMLRTHARTAGIRAVFLGSHVLRHSHASRQIDLGASATIVGDILGHRRPETTSAYVRVALRHLRGLSLPVPK